MEKILFKNPKVEYVKLTTGQLAPSAEAVWVEVPSDERHQDTVEIVPTAGSTEDKLNDDGEVVGSYTAKTTYVVNVKTFFPIDNITDNDGLVDGEYAIRITEKTNNKGYICERCNVSAQTSYNASDGQATSYVFKVLKPATGNSLKPFPIPAP